jgi:uncharacterized iron-regulated protein
MAAVTETDLSKLMRALADGGHERAVDLREKAEAFDIATHGFVAADPQTHTVRQMVGAWARARRVYIECTGGEPVITS